MSQNLLASLPPVPISIGVLAVDYNRLTSLPRIPDGLGFMLVKNNYFSHPIADRYPEYGLIYPSSYSAWLAAGG